MNWDRYQLPDQPLDLDTPVDLSRGQHKEAVQIISALSEALGNLPVVLSQDGKVVCYSDTTDEPAAQRLARIAGRVWREGQVQNAQEAIRFEEEIVEGLQERMNLMLYTTHVGGALTLSIGWQITISLTQLRAEASDACRLLRRVIGS
jgi:hypothetical protein